MTTAAAPRESTIRLRELRLAAMAWGDPAQPPLIAVHGWLDNAASFARLAPLLDRHVIAIDLAGHGRSDHRGAGNSYAWVDYLAEFDEVVAQFGPDRVDLLGHSLGAALVGAYAAAVPDKVARLLLIEGLGPLASGPERTLEVLRRGMLARSIAQRSPLRVFKSVDAAAAARQRASGISPESARLIVERGLRPRGAGSAVDGFIWSSDPRLTLPSLQRFSEDQVHALISGITAPTLLVLAEPAAPYLAPELIERRIGCLPDIEVVRLAGGHHLHLDDPRPVADAIREFLESRTARPDASDARAGTTRPDG